MLQTKTSRSEREERAARLRPIAADIIMAAIALTDAVRGKKPRAVELTAWLALATAVDAWRANANE